MIALELHAKLCYRGYILHCICFPAANSLKSRISRSSNSSSSNSNSNSSSSSSSSSNSSSSSSSSSSKKLRGRST